MVAFYAVLPLELLVILSHSSLARGGASELSKARNAHGTVGIAARDSPAKLRICSNFRGPPR